MCRWVLSCLAALVLMLVPVSRGDEIRPPGMDVLVYPIIQDADDGTEVALGAWHGRGVDASDLNYFGQAQSNRYDIGLRFKVSDLNQGEQLAFARLVFSGTGGGRVDTVVESRIVGLALDGVPPFEKTRPSLQPKTMASVPWEFEANWPEAAQGSVSRTALLRKSANIAPIINEIIARSRWGQGPYGKTIGLVVEGLSINSDNYLIVEDSRSPYPDHRAGPRLELYRTVRSTFVGQELLGRPTDCSVTLNAMSLLRLEAFVEYGLGGASWSHSTPPVLCPAGVPFEFVLDRLQRNRAYQYRLRYRELGETSFATGPTGSFQTQRSRGSAFRFTVQSDSHIWETQRRQIISPELYVQTLAHVAADRPDFHIDLGDTFYCEDYSGGDALDYEDAIHRHLAQRPFLDLIGHSVPLFFVLGNHEGEQGWRQNGTPDNLAVWATNARKLVYPNPGPDGFYTGCVTESNFVGLPENYYAFEWGDALFVMLDPYRYTTSKPHGAGGSPGSGDNWDWTLGYEQYDWLRRTLENSTATFKLVFAHQVTGGADLYGRGGVEAATHTSQFPGSFEWGGLDVLGRDVFALKRPGWGVPIQQLFEDNKVTIFFHGHDHVFAKQDLGGVVYQECPVPSDAGYMLGHFGYVYGTVIRNSGHLRVTVSRNRLLVEYVRAFLPGDGVDGLVSHAYQITTAH